MDNYRRRECSWVSDSFQASLLQVPSWTLSPSFQLWGPAVVNGRRLGSEARHVPESSHGRPGPPLESTWKYVLSIWIIPCFLPSHLDLKLMVIIEGIYHFYDFFKLTGKRVVLTATKRAASCRFFQGQTLHSFSGILDGRFSDEQVIRRIRENPDHLHSILTTDALLVDEASMFSLIKKLYR